MSIEIQVKLMRTESRLELYLSSESRRVETHIDTTDDQVGQITGYINGKATDLFTLDEAIEWLEA